ncbi:hypothetical protein KUTeg_003335 [Tegillarca granosa]|uniref:C1q domain-containing protein n=1 Tax=Tegillarca granosa TaxID=220873 RepID=A0ABQ9FLW2_TEGGR|nr:hypothetical protein KUTeg_003335 [Tegillarca granosa]
MIKCMYLCLGESRKEVAFFATLLGHTTTSSAIVFNNVITNIGGGYNIRDGTFHCPTPGLYLFSSTLTASGSAYVVGHLMKNQKQVARFHENINVRYYPSASLTAVLRLTTGDKVWIKGYGIRYYSPDNAFTGVLIKTNIKK